MKDIKAIKGKFYIAGLISEGEHDRQDFKYQISDAVKIARSLSAFSNHRGGRLLMGVKDNGTIAGVRSEEDIYVVEQAAQMYCRPAVEVEFTAYKATDEGNIVIKAEVPEAKRRPVKARLSDGRWRAFMRVKDENILASPLMVRVWKEREGSEGMLLQAGGEVDAVLDDVRRYGPVKVQEIAKRTHLSVESVERSIVWLASRDLLRFVKVGQGFLVDVEREEPEGED